MFQFSITKATEGAECIRFLGIGFIWRCWLLVRGRDEAERLYRQALPDEPGNVFSDDVEFDIYLASGNDGLDIGMFIGIGNDGYVEFLLFDVKDGQADAVDGNRAFFDDQLAEFPGEFEPVFPAAAQGVLFQANGCRVDMSLNDMAVQPSIHDETSFQIDLVSWFPGV